MKIAAYIQMERAKLNFTGISRHVINMMRGMQATPGVEVKVLASRHELTVGKIRDNSGLHGFPVVSLPLSRRNMEMLWFLAGRPKLERWCPDADWIYTPADVYIPRGKVKVAVTVRDVAAFEQGLPQWNDAKGKRFRARQLAKWKPMLEQSDLILTVSEFSRRRLIELLKADERKIVVVGNGVEQRFYDIAGADVSMEKPLVQGKYVLVNGGLRTMKGAAAVLAVAEELKKVAPEFSVAVVGLKEDQWTARAAAVGNIRELGFVADDALPALCKNAVALLCVSKYEGFGIPIAEAMAAGTVAVAAKNASLPEVAGDAGILVDDTDAPGIADLLVSLGKDEGLRAKYIEKGKLRAGQFTWDACVKRLLDAFGRG